MEVAGLRIGEEADPEQIAAKAISAGLDAHNEAFLPSAEVKRFCVVARDADDAIKAGIFGVTAVNWAFIAEFWVAEAHRKQGVGSRLLAEAEAAAKARGCDFIYLDTFTFQAPELYLRHGYREFGRLEDCPTGHSRIWLAKTL